MPRKKSRDLELFIVDIFVATQTIKIYVQPFSDEDSFRHSNLHWDATIRQLEVIGEALNNLLDDAHFLSLSPDYFRKIVNFRNVISHGYFGIDTHEVWNVICEKIDILYLDLQEIVKRNFDLTAAIESEIDEYEMLQNMQIVTFLKGLK